MQARFARIYIDERLFCPRNICLVNFYTLNNKPATINQCDSLNSLANILQSADCRVLLIFVFFSKIKMQHFVRWININVKCSYEFFFTVKPHFNYTIFSNNHFKLITSFNSTFFRFNLIKNWIYLICMVYLTNIHVYSHQVWYS